MQYIMQMLSFLSFGLALKSIVTIFSTQDYHPAYLRSNVIVEESLEGPLAIGRKIMVKEKSNDSTISVTTTTVAAIPHIDNDDDSNSHSHNDVRDLHNQFSQELQPTFASVHDFAKGPRPRPYSIGRSISELAQNATTIGSKPVNVTFYQNRGSYYAAAWLASTEAFFQNPNLNFERVRNDKQQGEGWVLEQGTWVGVNDRENFMTTNMLDFFVHHLSRYKGGTSVRGPELKINWQRYIDGMDRMQSRYEEKPFNNPNLDRNGRVLVIMPFHGASDNHSGQDEKNLHLNNTVKALARVFPSIVVTVCDQTNYDFITKHSGLNEYFYDVVLVKNLKDEPIQSCINLPMLSSLQVRRMMEHAPQRYDPDFFQWVYYTESDQPPHLTNVNALLQQALHSPKTAVIPFRGHPAALAHELDMTVAKRGAKKFTELNKHKKFTKIDDLRDYSCCFGQNVTHRRNSNRIKYPWASPEIELFQQYGGHAQANGWCNPMLLTCITCTLQKRNGACPTTTVDSSISAQEATNVPETTLTIAENAKASKQTNTITIIEGAPEKEEAHGGGSDNDKERDIAHEKEQEPHNTTSIGRRRRHLQPTFDGVRDFAQDGPREQPLKVGRTISEIAQDWTTDGDKSVNVTFFENIGSPYYAAAWLATMTNFLENPNLNVTKLQTEKEKGEGWVLEQGTWVGVNRKENYRTVDMLDFFVHHLSRYKGGYSVRGPHHKVNWQRYLQQMERMQHAYEEEIPLNNPNLDRNGRVLVIMPFHGASDNHSGQDEKALHLNNTVKAMARVFPSIVVTVCDQTNYDFVTKASGLNEYLYDVVLVKNLKDEPIESCISLPMLSNVQVRLLMENNETVQQQRYDPQHFQWVYYTESDQPLHLTNVNALLHQTLHNPKTVVVPHRSYPVALETELDVNHGKDNFRKFVEWNRHKAFHHVNDLRDYSCCFDKRTTQNPKQKRIGYKWESSKVQIFQQEGDGVHAQATGTCNANRLACTVCTFQKRNGSCPQ